MGQAQSGPIGPIGPKGEQGIQGPIGPLGPQGEIGPIGPKGDQGIQGIPGVSNIPGPIGLLGPQGPKGDQGIQGEIGPMGLLGQQGQIGPKGEQGIQGIQGVSNIPGPIGPKGAQGIQGIQGLVGPIGPIGEVSKDFMKGNSLWCADGELCKIPINKKGIDFGYGGSKISDLGNLTLETDDNIDFKAGSGKDLTAALNNHNLYLFGSRGVQFGHGYDKEVNAGQISYGRWDGEANGSLNIVGGGKNGQTRIVRVWDALRIGDWYFEQHPNGNLHIHRGNRDDWNAALTPENGGSIYARGNTMSSGRNILAELNDLNNNVVRKDKRYAIQNNDNRRLQLESGTARAVGENTWGNWEAMRFIQG